MPGQKSPINMHTTIFRRLLLVALAAAALTSCDLNNLITPPTKQQMQGTWVLTQATDAQGVDITQKVSFPITAIQLTDDNGMVGTMGPLFTYIVYGGSKWTEVAGKMDQLFDYVNFQFNTGEFFVADGQVNSFTVEAKLQATAAVGGRSITEILSIFGVNTSYLQKTIYHKFKNVAVDFDGKDTMIWTFDSETQAFYNYKDAGGDTVVWGGWPTTGFQKCRFVFTRKTLKLEDLVTAARR
jgi:hypothetical protein